jgi:pteridine reductase
MDLSGKTALVTGAACRIGHAISLALGQAGANVVVHYRTSESAAVQLVHQLESVGVRGWALRADLRVERQLLELVKGATALAGPLSVLVNNASVFPHTTFETVSRGDLLSSIELDAWAPFELAQQFAHGACDRAHIVNMLDTRTVAQYSWDHFAYCAAKHLLALFTELMAIRMAPRIAVNGVAPGVILPPEGLGDDYLEARKLEIPMKRIGDRAFVADAVLFLVRSEYITGQTIFVDGGRHLLGGSHR